MAKSKKETSQRDPLPEDFHSLESFWEFWDTHSSADYEDFIEDVVAEVDLQSSKVYCPVQKDLIKELQTHARQQGVSVETLINLWLREKMMETSHSG